MNCSIKNSMEKFFEALSHKTGCSGFGSHTLVRNFQATYSFCPYSASLCSIVPLTEISTKRLLCVLSAAGAYSWQLCSPSCAEYKNKGGSPTLHPPLSLHDLLQESFAYLPVFNPTNKQCFYRILPLNPF